LIVDPGDHPAAARELNSLLRSANDLFVRGDRPTRLVHGPRGPRTVPLDKHMVAHLAHERAKVYRPHKDGFVKTTLPERVANLYLALEAWDLPELVGVTSAPLVRLDGTVFAEDGFDGVSGQWCTGVPKLALPERPTREDAAAALVKLRLLLQTFPFADAERFEGRPGIDLVDPTSDPGQDESAALAALLSAVCRPSLPLAPGCMITAPSLSGSGAGKGLLGRVFFEIAYGQQPSAVTAGSDPNELDKRLATELMDASQALLLDNVNSATLKSDLLASVLTERPARVRLLGQSRMVSLNSSAFVIVNGNGLQASEDLVRRMLLCELDPRMENPEARPFTEDLLAHVVERRPELLAATLTIVRWAIQNPEELMRGRAMGSYGQWARWVRDPLLTLGCADVALRVDAVKQADPERQRRGALLEALHCWKGEEAFTAADLEAAPFELQILVSPTGASRQRFAAELGRLSNMRVGGFVLRQWKPAGQWSPAKYQVLRTD
jgi:hypothetical protein